MKKRKVLKLLALAAVIVVGLALWAVIGFEKGIYLGHGSMVGYRSSNFSFFREL